MCSAVRGRTDLRVLLIALALCAPATAQVPQLLRDLNTAPPPEPSSWPSDFQAFGARVLFHAETTPTGGAMFVSDGTAANTALFLDHEPGPGGFDTRIWDLTPFGTGWIFASEDQRAGPEVWLTDGTPTGTRMLMQTHPGSTHAGPRSFTPLGNRMVFAAHDPTGGIEPWITDGTPMGTRRLIDLDPGVDSSSPQDLHSVPGRVVFSASDGQLGRELWATDGTSQGTVLCADILPGPLSSDPYVLGSLPNGDVVLGVVNAPVGGAALWVSDGTPAGTSPLNLPLTTARRATGLRVGNELWFIGFDPAHGDEPWATDGTAGGTRRLFEFVTGSGSANPRFLGVLPTGRVLVRAQDRLHVTDGTPAGTSLLAPTARLVSTDSCRLGNALLFRAGTSAAGEELWISDGTPAGTGLLADLRAGSASSSPFGFVPLGNRVVFAARDDLHGSEPWITDGTVAGTSLLVNLAASAPNQTAGSRPETGIDRAGRLGLLAATPDVAPWQSDGTTTGTTPLFTLPANQEMRQLNEDGNPRQFVVGGELVLLIDDATLGTRLWIDRGAGPMPGPTFATLPGSRPLLDSLVIGDSAWFSGQQLVHYRAGVATTVNFGGTGSPFAFGLSRLGQWAITSVFVQGVDGLWRCDGATPTLLHSFPGFRPEHLMPVRGRVYFTADDGNGAGLELWSTDGTPGGTTVLDLRPGPTWSWVQPLAALGNQLLFQDRDGASGANGLWLTDGTLAATVPFDPFPPGTTQGPIEVVVPCGPDRFAFVMDDGIHGREPWLLSGTGARLVADLVPGPGSADPRVAGATGEEFWIRTGGTAPMLWRSDGTTAGTTQVLAGAVCDSMFVESGGRLYLDHDEGMHGSEPWVVRTGASAQRIGAGCGIGNRVAWLESEDPVLGASFTLRGGGGPAGRLGAILLGLPAVTPSVLGSGCVLHLQAAGFGTLLFVADAAAPWSLSLPLPGTPALDDVQIVVQQVSGPSTNALGFELGDALRLTLGTF